MTCTTLLHTNTLKYGLGTHEFYLSPKLLKTLRGKIRGTDVVEKQITRKILGWGAPLS